MYPTEDTQKARIALFGFPPPIFSRWHHLPNLELAREKLGVESSPVEIRELVPQLPMIDEGKAQTSAQRWVKKAEDVVEPSTYDVTDAAQLFLAMSDMLSRKQANAIATNCVELTTLKVPSACHAMTRLRDEGIHAACKGDVTTLLTMMLLGYVADGPAFTGNVVGANPESNTLMIAHCVVPTRMASLGPPPRRYTLRDYHGTHAGVTAHVELDIGQELTVAQPARNIDKIMLLRAELVDCRDTITCRTTVSARVSDVRNFVRCAFGNHHAVVHGDYVVQTKALSETIGIGAVQL